MQVGMYLLKQHLALLRVSKWYLTLCNNQKNFASAVWTRFGARINLRTVPVRHLNLHEYQSANIMREHGVRMF